MARRGGIGRILQVAKRALSGGGGGRRRRSTRGRRRSSGGGLKRIVRKLLR